MHHGNPQSLTLGLCPVPRYVEAKNQLAHSEDITFTMLCQDLFEDWHFNLNSWLSVHRIHRCFQALPVLLLLRHSLNINWGRHVRYLRR